MCNIFPQTQKRKTTYFFSREHINAINMLICAEIQIFI